MDWFLDAQGARRLRFAAAGAVGLLLLVMLGGILPAKWRLSADVQKIERLKREGTATAGDLRILKSDLRALSAEARKQVPWSDLLHIFGQELPPTLRLHRVELSKPAPPRQPRRANAPPAPEPKSTLEIQAMTPLRPGGPPLLDVARFMAGVMRDSAVNRRFELKRWEIKPSATVSKKGRQFLQVTIALTERRR